MPDTNVICFYCRNALPPADCPNCFEREQVATTNPFITRTPDGMFHVHEQTMTGEALMKCCRAYMEMWLKEPH